MCIRDSIVTVWSAPNYCYRCGNVASVFQVDDLLHTAHNKTDEAPSRFNASHFKIFDAVPDQDRMHPTRSTASQYFL